MILLIPDYIIIFHISGRSEPQILNFRSVWFLNPGTFIKYTYRRYIFILYTSPLVLLWASDVKTVNWLWKSVKNMKGMIFPCSTENVAKKAISSRFQYYVFWLKHILIWMRWLSTEYWIRWSRKPPGYGGWIIETSPNVEGFNYVSSCKGIIEALVQICTHEWWMDASDIYSSKQLCSFGNLVLFINE